MTILVSFHHESYRTFKHFYQKQVCRYWEKAFLGLPTYQRFVEWIPDALIPLCVYLKHCFGTCSGISFIDATALKVCHNRRINQHRVFDELAVREKLLWIGFMALRCIWWSMSVESC